MTLRSSGGCVGCSVAYHLARKTDLDICIIEKEHHLAQHQSGRNSGVLHPGFNYPPDSLKAEFATEGTRRMKEYCTSNDISLDELGVLVVATDNRERERLSEIQKQATQNNVETQILHYQDAIQEHEPHAAGCAALYCPEAASVDSQKYVYSLAGDAEDLGVDFFMGIRAQIVRDDGTLIKDPLFEHGKQSTHVLNAVSPGLTSSLPFGEHLAESVLDRME